MAGGTWTSQNKVRPGAYINCKSKSKQSATLGDRGIVTVPMSLPWGPEKTVIEIASSDNLFDVLGINIADDAAKLIREAFKRAKTLLLYRLNTGIKATATIEGLTITAKYSGNKGNNITIVIQNNIDDTSKFEVLTMFEGTQMDKQLVTTIAELKANNYVEFKGTGELKATAGIPLKGGSDGTVEKKDYPQYLADIELHDFNTMGITTKEQSIKAIVTTFIKRLREDEGKKVQAVLTDYAIADYEGIISVKNGVILSDNTHITADEAVVFIAGATAGSNINQSNTYSTYDDAIDVDIKYTNKEIIQALKNGEIVFTINDCKVVIEEDINTFTSFSDMKDKSFSKNRVIRVLDGINNDSKLIWSKKYLGKADNDDNRRDLYRKDLIKHLETLQGLNAVTNVVPEDVEVLPGEDKDAVVATIGAEPIDSMEKLYMNIDVR
ncbi:phage tail sheath family protein [Clostridium botulinum]|uniref:phage tail sheath family protein n=1 Tax=Clostridium botulinum TaxID=1491 RepID=UPI0006A439BD|nr:phage tail sheath family protein [Clostridium botulinum]KOC49988.1 hypothetical protein ADU88_04140 [Clostridium botulinum]